MKWILIFLISFSFSTFAKNSKGGKKRNKKAAAPAVRLNKVGSCDNPNATKKVLILKQWHLPPTTVTKGFKEKYPQEQNQTALFRYLEDAVKQQDVQLIVGEGCEGPINAEFKGVFNGWDYASLHAQAFQKNYSKFITQVPLKIEAKYGDKIETICGDNEALIQEGNLRLSNLRGWTGFLSRLREQGSADSQKTKPYAESAAELLKVPKDTATEKLISLIKERIKQDIEAFKNSLNERNDLFVETLKQQDFKKAAVVIGGLHAQDLKEKLKSAELDCEVLEPPGYKSTDEKLIQEFERLL